MLINLYIENYVLFDKQNLSFKSGFSALTGDTGAGKSLIIDALSYLTGERLNVDIVKDRNKNTFIEGSFEFKNPKTFKILNEGGFETEELYIVSREITPEGRSISRLNNRGVTLGFIKQVFSNELDIHNQRDTQYLLNKSIHLNLLDSYSNHKKLLNQVKKAYNNYKEIENEINNLKDSVFDENEIEFIKTQVKEIKDADISQPEINKLKNRLKEINNFEEIFVRLNQSNDLFIKDKGIIEQMYDVNENIKKLSFYEDYFKLNERVESSYLEIVDISHEIADFLSSLEFDENEVNEIEARLFEVNHLTKKYGGSFEAMMSRLIQMEKTLETFESKELILDELYNKLKLNKDEYLKLAKSLSKSRIKYIESLEKDIILNLKDLHLKDAVFKVDLKEKKASENGVDDIEFLISMNKGSTLKPLNQVASGGELSRLMLGLKVIFSRLFGISTVIFDEIDAGVSGSIATSIGLKMSELSKTSQVFAVTHLAQVAACSNNHYHVEKDNDGLFTSTSVKKLDEITKIEKLAMMSTGSNSLASINAAKELYYNSQKLVAGIDG